MRPFYRCPGCQTRDFVAALTPVNQRTKRERWDPPALRYVLNRTPAYSQKFMENLAERLMEANDPPTGGLSSDGRFNTLHEQASFPMLARNEMANGSMEEVADKLRNTS